MNKVLHSVQQLDSSLEAHVFANNEIENAFNVTFFDSEAGLYVGFGVVKSIGFGAAKAIAQSKISGDASEVISVAIQY